MVKKELGERFIFLYVYGINSQDLCSLIKTLDLPIIVTREVQYADNVLALDQGKNIAFGSPKEIQNNKQVIDSYLGTIDAA